MSSVSVLSVWYPKKLKISEIENPEDRVCIINNDMNMTEIIMMFCLFMYIDMRTIMRKIQIFILKK